MLFFTSATTCYLPKARILGKSIKKYHPESKFYLVLSDELPQNFQLADEPFDGILYAKEIVLQHVNMSKEFWMFLHDVTELCTAVKGWAALELLDRECAEKIVYLDPDMVVFNALDHLDEMLNEHDIVITPHRLYPEELFDNEYYGDQLLLSRGAFNLGFLAVRNNENGRKFLAWWRKMLEFYCYVDDPNGLFTDQKIIDLAPSFFESLHICRDKGYNISWWNVTQRSVHGTIDDLKVDDNPAYIYHFSHYDSGLHKKIIERYCSSNQTVETLHQWYTIQQNANGQKELFPLKSCYDFFCNGEVITPMIRKMSRKRSDIVEIFAYKDPFQIHADSLYTYYRKYYSEYFSNRLNAEYETGAPDYRQLYSELLGSRYYRTGQRVARIADSIAPENSIRKRIYKRLRRLAGKMYRVTSKRNRQERSRRKMEAQTKDEFDIFLRQYYAAPKKDVAVEASVVVLNAEYFGHVYRVLQSVIANNSRKINFEIIVSRGLYPEPERKIKESFTGVRFAEFNRFSDIIDETRGRYLFVINESCQMCEDFIKSAIQLMESKKAGLVQPMVKFSDNTILEAGAILTKDGVRHGYGRFDDSDKKCYHYTKEVDCILPLNFLLDKHAYELVGGMDDEKFDSIYAFADLSYKMREKNISTMYFPEVFLYDMREFKSVELTQGKEESRVAFVEKWGTVLQQENISDNTEFFWGRDRSKTKKCILIIDDHIPKYDTSAGERSTYQVMQLLVANGYNIKFSCCTFQYVQPYASKLEEMGVELVGFDGQGMDDLVDYLQQHGNFIDYAYICRPHNAKLFMPIVKRFSAAKIVYVATDLHFLREMRANTISGNSAPSYTAISEQEEIALIDSAEMVLLLSTFEIELMKSKIANAKLFYYPIFVYKEIPHISTGFTERKDILFVGGFAHTPNVDAMIWFCEEVLPIIVGKNSDIVLHIVGSNPTSEIVQLESANVIVEGFVEDDLLDEMYLQCRVCVVPLRYGAGVKGKVVEAMHKGIPIVSTSIGVEGLPDISSYLSSTDTAIEFAERVIELYNDPDLWQSMSFSNQQYIQSHFMEESAIEVYESVFGGSMK